MKYTAHKKGSKNKLLTNNKLNMEKPTHLERGSKVAWALI